MKNKNTFFPFLIALVFSIGFLACSEDDKDEVVAPAATVPNVTVNSACAGGDGLCMNYGATQKGGPATLTVQSQNNKVRVYWQNGTGSAFEQVELDIYSLSAGTFDVNDLATPNSAFLQYFSTAGGVVNPAYGTVTVSTLDTLAGVTGTFTVTMKDSTKVTNGIFTNVKK